MKLILSEKLLMTDLKPFFDQVVTIVQENVKDIPQQGQSHEETYYVRDSFPKEARGLYQHIVGINSFLDQIKQQYLNVSDANVSKGLSMADKDNLDEDVQIKIRALYEKLKVLQNYESKREVEKPKGHWISNYFGDEEEDNKQNYLVSLETYRNNTLKFINECLNNTSKKFQGLQTKRTSRERQLNLLNFQNLEDDLDLNIQDDDAYNPALEHEIPLITQEQVQEFELENKHLLNLKNDQLSKVENLHSTMVDIINMQAEITFQIETQSNQIANLIENQDQINADLTAGNKTLNKATSRNKRSANIIIYTSIILGILVLLLDAIKF